MFDDNERSNSRLQSPVDVWKNPLSHLAHAVPLSAFTNPALHAHSPFVPQTPFRQLHVAGAFFTGESRHLPDPAIPSSHDVHPASQLWHVAPKCPGAQVSQDEPVNPGRHAQVLDDEQTPPVLEHAGEQDDDWMATRERVEVLPNGSSRMSGTECQSTTRLSRAIHVLDESAMDWVVESDVEREEFGEVGSGAKADWPA